VPPAGLRRGYRRLRARGAALACFVCATLGAVVVGVVPVGPAGAANNDALGAPHPAKGSSVTVAVITDAGGHVGGTGPLVAQGAKAAVAYLNEYKGGLAGHKITLYVCENKGTPAGGRACATDVVQKRAVAVMVPFTGEGAAEVPPIVRAGIPFITLTGSSTAELATSGAFSIEGGLASDLGVMALHAKQHGYKKVILLVTDQAAAVQGAQVLGRLVFQHAGVGFQVIPATPGSDMVPQLRAAVADGASAVGVLGDQSLCSSFLRAYKRAGTHLPRYLLVTCQDPSILDSPSLDGVLKGSYLVGAMPGWGTGNAAALYSGIVSHFMPQVNPNPRASANEAAGLTALLTLSSLMTGSAGSSLTAASVLHRAQTAQGVAIPFSGGQTFTCDGKAIARLPSVCSSSAAVGVVGSGYSVKNVAILDPGSLF